MLTQQQREKYTKLPNTDCNCEQQKMDIKKDNEGMLNIILTGVPLHPIGRGGANLPLHK